MLPPAWVLLATWLTAVELRPVTRLLLLGREGRAPDEDDRHRAEEREALLDVADHLPKVTARPKGRTRQRKISRELVSPVGFSKGAAALALRKPPPLVPDP